MSQTEFHLGHRPELDGVRGIAIILVFISHSNIPFIQGGNIGVDIFFGLSGFLITYLISHEFNTFGSINLKKFYIRRILRLTPALGLLLTAFAVESLLTTTGVDLYKRFKILVYTALYFSDFAIAFNIIKFGYLLHTWSLAVEEHFYLIFPVILLILLKKKASQKSILIFIISIIFIIVIYRALSFDAWNGDEIAIARFYYGFDYRFDGILTGCVLGLLASWNRLPKITRIQVLLAIITLTYFIIFISNKSPIFYFGLVIINLSTVVVIAYILNNPSNWLSNPLLVWIGKLSYGLYLWHVLIIWIFEKYTGSSHYTSVFFGLLITFAVSSMSYYGVEKPILRLKSRFAANNKTQVESNSIFITG